MNEVAQIIHEWAVSRGFWEHEFIPSDCAGIHSRPVLNPSIYEEKLMLIVSEAAEVLEARRDKNEKLEEEEMADLIIRALDYCAARGFDIDGAVAHKMAKNQVRPYLHGRAR